MKKKIMILLMITVLVFTVVGCKKEFDYKEAMKTEMEKLQNAKKAHVGMSIKFNDTIAEKLQTLAETEEEKLSEEDIKLIDDTLSNIELSLEEKVDIDNFIIDMNMGINYADESFIALDLFMNEEMLFVNEPKLLTKGVLVKFDFINEMYQEQGLSMDGKSFMDIVKNQMASQQELSKNLMPTINRIIKENVGEPEVLETTIDFNSEELKTNEVKYTMTYKEALELAKVFATDEEFINEYKSIVKSQMEYMNSISGGYGTTEEEVMAEVDKGIEEVVKAIDELLADEEVVANLEKYNVTVSYFFDDVLKEIKYDFDFVTLETEYYSVNEELTYDTPVEEESLVINNMESTQALMGVLNFQEVQNLQNHKLITEFQKLEEIGN